MKTNKKQLLTALVLGVVVMILFFGGCKKDLTSDSNNLKKPDLQMSNEGGTGKAKVLRQSPGLKIEVKSKTIERISPTLKEIDKITSALNEEQSKKKNGGSITTSNVTFTASLSTDGTYYNCHGEVVPDGGPHDWYIINWNTGVYTYIGTSADYYIDLMCLNLLCMGATGFGRKVLMVPDLPDTNI